MKIKHAYTNFMLSTEDSNMKSYFHHIYVMGNIYVSSPLWGKYVHGPFCVMPSTFSYPTNLVAQAFSNWLHTIHSHKLTSNGLLDLTDMNFLPFS